MKTETIKHGEGVVELFTYDMDDHEYAKLGDNGEGRKRILITAKHDDGRPDEEIRLPFLVARLMAKIISRGA